MKKKENPNITLALIKNKGKTVSIKVKEEDYLYLKKLSDNSGATIPSLIKQIIRRHRCEFEI